MAYSLPNPKRRTFFNSGKQSFQGLDYFGTMYVDTDQDNDYFGLIFGYQSSSMFYVVMWKKVSQTYWDAEPFEAHGEEGVTIKVRQENKKKKERARE
jgi:hypothetical protein